MSGQAGLEGPSAAGINGMNLSGHESGGTGEKKERLS